MASGPEHYRAAEAGLAEAEQFMADNVVDIEHDEAADLFGTHTAIVAQAHIHAVLALAAATAQNIRRNGAVEDVDGPAEWERVLGGSS